MSKILLYVIKQYFIRHFHVVKESLYQWSNISIFKQFFIWFTFKNIRLELFYFHLSQEKHTCMSKYNLGRCKYVHTCYGNTKYKYVFEQPSINCLEQCNVKHLRQIVHNLFSKLMKTLILANTMRRKFNKLLLYKSSSMRHILFLHITMMLCMCSYAYYCIN